MIPIGQAGAAVVDNLRRVLELRQAIAGLPPAPPRDVPAARWRCLLEDSRRFLADDPGWALLALDLGWTPAQLWGANAIKPYARVDQQGLLWLINRARIDDLGDGYCVLLNGTGTRTIYRARRPALDEISLPWELKQ